MPVNVLGFWFLGIHWEKEWLLALLSAAMVAGSAVLYLRERLAGKPSIPASLYLVLVALYVATVAVGLKVSEIYDRMWYIYK